MLRRWAGAAGSAPTPSRRAPGGHRPGAARRHARPGAAPARRRPRRRALLRPGAAVSFLPGRPPGAELDPGCAEIDGMCKSRRRNTTCQMPPAARRATGATWRRSGLRRSARGRAVRRSGSAPFVLARGARPHSGPPDRSRLPPGNTLGKDGRTQGGGRLVLRVVGTRGGRVAAEPALEPRCRPRPGGGGARPGAHPYWDVVTCSTSPATTPRSDDGIGEGSSATWRSCSARARRGRAGSRSGSSSTRSRIPSFSRMFARWRSTVLRADDQQLRRSRSLVWPSAIELDHLELARVSGSSGVASPRRARSR